MRSRRAVAGDALAGSYGKEMAARLGEIEHIAGSVPGECAELGGVECLTQGAPRFFALQGAGRPSAIAISWMRFAAGGEVVDGDGSL